jgi:phage terminase large subunit
VIDSVTQREASDFGWITNSKTRPLMLSNLQEAITQKVIRIPDKNIINQMLSFARNDSGRPEATLGSHDDLVIALSIGVAVHQTAPKTITNYFYDYDIKKYSIH